MQERTILLVGYGNMGRALCAGWVKAGVVEAGHIHVIEPEANLLLKAWDAGFAAFQQLEDLPENISPHYVVFAVKPQVFDQVVPSYARFAKNATFMSILAGVAMSKFSAILGENAAIVRIMPNMPAAIGEGMLAFCDNGCVSVDSRHFAEKLLAANGALAHVHESQMDAVTALSGSGPAYVFYLIECLASAGEEIGLEPELALLLARQTVKGAGVLASGSEVLPHLLREQVTSPGGTTAAGLEILMQEKGLEKMLGDCVKAAHARSVALGQ